MAKHRIHSLEFKRQVAQEFLAGETLHGLAKRYDLSRNLIRNLGPEVGGRRARRRCGRCRSDRTIRSADRRPRTPRRQAGAGAGVRKRGSKKRTAAEKRAYIRDCRPAGLSVTEGCRLMGIARSTYYDAAPSPTDDTAIVEAIAAICEEFECYGWRRVRAALRQQGIIVNHKKIKRLMREHGLQPRIRRRYVATTDSDHDQPIFPNRTKDVIVDRPDRLWVADITYVAIAVGFVYVAVILDAWSRRVVGYAISRSIDARLTMAALKSAIEQRKPPPGCMHHSDSQRITASSRTA